MPMVPVTLSLAHRLVSLFSTSRLMGHSFIGRVILHCSDVTVRTYATDLGSALLPVQVPIMEVFFFVFKLSFSQAYGKW